MKRLINAKFLLVFILMLSLTTVNSEAQRKRNNSGRTIWIINGFTESPEGYSNLRATPGGKIIGKIYDTINEGGCNIWIDRKAYFDGAQWIKVYTSTGNFRGYIHHSQINGAVCWGASGGGIEDCSKRVRVDK